MDPPPCPPSSQCQGPGARPRRRAQAEVQRERPQVAQARARQDARYEGIKNVRVNADIEGDLLSRVATPDDAGRDLLVKAADRFGLSARGYHRILRVDRTIADLEGVEDVARHHVAEAASYRLSINSTN